MAEKGVGYQAPNAPPPAGPKGPSAIQTLPANKKNKPLCVSGR